MLTKTATAVKLLQVDHAGKLSSAEPLQVASCRALRICSPDRFLFVSFSRKIEQGILLKKLGQFRNEGIRLQNIRYSFLRFTDDQVAATPSQMIFFHEDEDWSVDSLLASFGDLGSVYTDSGYGKYAARLHLAFSSTIPSLDVPNDQAVKIKDYKANDGSVHTDGIGLIRDSFAREVCATHDLPAKTSAFQIRRGGIKGVLVRYPDEVFEDILSKTIRSEGEGGFPYKIAYRPSMLKFKDGPTQLELLIVLLSTLGVGLSVLEGMLDNELHLIGSMLTDREQALKCIGQVLYRDPSRESWGHQIYDMLVSQQSLQEPYLETELLKFQGWRYNALKKKLNIFVKKAAYVMGVFDEAGVLAENEVFLKFSGRSISGNGGCISGEVCITRMPCFSPGDIRKFHAVGRSPQLEHLENVIGEEHDLFPRNSQRDLDGDLYLVIWEPSLLPPRNAPAVPREAAGTALVRQHHMLENMADEAIATFAQYRGCGMLVGKLHNQWLRAAQATAALANSPLARQLVKLNEAALDMLKTGVDPQVLEDRFSRLWAQYDGMTDPSMNTANPVALLRARVDAAWQATAATARAPRRPWSPHASLVLESEDPELWAEMLQEAPAVMRAYNRELRDAIVRDKQYDEEKTGSSSMRGRVKHTELLRRAYVRKYFSGESAVDCDRERMRASAWYYYGYTQDKVKFAWLGARYLNSISASHSADNTVDNDLAEAAARALGWEML